LAACSACGRVPDSATRSAPLKIQRTSKDAASTAITIKPIPPHLSYYGGRVLSNVKVIAVFWGPNVNSAVKSGVGPFYAAVTNNVYMDWLSEYDTPTQNIGRGSFAGAVTITPHNSATNLADADIEAELIAQIYAGALAWPDSNTSYMVHFPPGIRITDPTGAVSCNQFCAYHNSGSIPGRCRTRWDCSKIPCVPITTCDPPISFAYSVLPDLGDPGCNGGCGTSSQFNNQTVTASHELIESVTDPGHAPAWYDVVRGEIGDICNGLAAPLPGTSFSVQREWSNVAVACIVSECVPSCVGKCDGSDSCGGTCPNLCAPGLACYHDACCLPNCVGKCGGDDGCGGSCPNSCPPGLSCDHDLCCLPNCVGKCGGDDGCGGQCPACCIPDCFGKNGGSDGCGGTCPSFPPL
jgi:hypothetical protein